MTPRSPGLAAAILLAGVGAAALAEGRGDRRQPSAADAAPRACFWAENGD